MTLRWTPVGESLPEMDQVVLVSFKSGYDGHPCLAFGARQDDGEGWCWGTGGRHGVRLDHDATWNDIEVDDEYEVTHWAPLQSPDTNQLTERKEG